MSHEAWMRAAIAEGKAGAARGNIGVGSVIVREGRLVAGGHNEVLSGCDPTRPDRTRRDRRPLPAHGRRALAGEDPGPADVLPGECLALLPPDYR